MNYFDVFFLYPTNYLTHYSTSRCTSTTLNLASKLDLKIETSYSIKIPTFVNSATCSDLNQQQQESSADEAVTSDGQLEQGSSREAFEQGELTTTGNKKSRQPRILRTDTYAHNNKRRRPVAKVVKKRVRVAKGK